jgi:hypothetical protein
MISLATALKLKQAGLDWVPELNDFFAIPDRGMDERIFVISDMPATIENILGKKIIAFQGASEWALDNLLAEDVVWLPREEQLRKALEAVLFVGGEYEIRLESTLMRSQCVISYRDVTFEYSASDASETYAEALLDLLTSRE